MTKNRIFFFFLLILEKLLLMQYLRISIRDCPIYHYMIILMSFILYMDNINSQVSYVITKYLSIALIRILLKSYLFNSEANHL